MNKSLLFALILSIISVSCVHIDTGPNFSPEDSFKLINTNSDQCLGIPSGSKKKGESAIQWPCGSYADHHWQLKKLNGGVYNIVNVNSRQCLGIPSGSKKKGKSAIQWPCGPYADHKWQLIKVREGVYNIVNVNSGQCLGIPSGSKKKGKSAIQWPCGPYADHEWLLLKLEKFVNLPSPPSDQEKVRLMKQYAPRLWMHSDEKYWPSSVEWSFNFVNRIWRKDSHWWLRTKQNLKKPSSVLPYFHGCDPNKQHTDVPCEFSKVPTYAFWHQVDEGEYNDAAFDIVYFFYFPYNRGKSVIKTIFRSHVGDWEHVTVRLFWKKNNKTGKWTLGPSTRSWQKSIYMSAHNFGEALSWENMPKVRNTQHPIVYSAWGSHGLWRESGRHGYEKIIAKTKTLTDHTNEGIAWDTWKNLETFDFNSKKGLGPTWKNTWPTWMLKDDPSKAQGSKDPNSGPIWRWGNQKQGKVIYPNPKEWYDAIILITPFYAPFMTKDDDYRLVDGPLGPVDKVYWNTPKID